MKVGFDYWQVCSHYPDYFLKLSDMHIRDGDDVYIISAVGEKRKGTVVEAIKKLGFELPVCELVFNDPKESPELKLEACKSLGIQVFYDDRDDVCRLLNKNGIISMRVTRKDNSTYDLGAEIK